MVCKSVKDWIVDFGRWVLWCKVWVCRWHTLVLIMVPSWFGVTTRLTSPFLPFQSMVMKGTA
jgi:hypothetical protein